jgi:hypothetical protein
MYKRLTYEQVELTNQDLCPECGRGKLLRGPAAEDSVNCLCDYCASEFNLSTKAREVQQMQTDAMGEPMFDPVTGEPVIVTAPRSSGKTYYGGRYLTRMPIPELYGLEQIPPHWKGFHQESIACPCIRCEKQRAKDQDYAAWNDRLYAEHGFRILRQKDEDLPLGVRLVTEGLTTNYNHPEIDLILDPGALTFRLLLQAGIRVKEGQRVTPNEDDYELAGMVQVNETESVPRLPVTWIKVNYKGQECLRLVLPDSKGSLDKSTSGMSYQWEGEVK